MEAPTRQRYDIRVVVYKGVSLEEVKRRFPVVPEREQDYRYLELEAAVRYLDDQIEQNWTPELTAQLTATRSTLLARFSSDK